MTPRFRCTACGNLTRFDVESTRTTRAYWHFTVGGDCSVEDETLIHQSVDAVTCRWCGASGDTIEHLPDGAVEGGAA